LAGQSRNYQQFQQNILKIMWPNTSHEILNVSRLDFDNFLVFLNPKSFQLKIKNSEIISLWDLGAGVQAENQKLF